MIGENIKSKIGDRVRITNINNSEDMDSEVLRIYKSYIGRVGTVAGYDVGLNQYTINFFKKEAESFLRSEFKIIKHRK